MPLCGSVTCGCGLTSQSLVVTGSGAPGDPWQIEGASPEKLTDTERLALAGGDLFEGLMVWTTDTDMLWVYDGSAWRLAYGKYGVTATGSGTATASTTTLISWSAETYDPHGFITPTSDTFTVPSGAGGLYIVRAAINASSGTFAAGTHLIVGGTFPRRSAQTNSASSVPPSFMDLIFLDVGDTITFTIQNATGSGVTFTSRADIYRVGKF